MANTRNNPLEDLAIHLPMICDRYELRDDVMPGAGRFRGGIGVVKEQRMLTDGFITHENDRHEDVPWGIFDGQPGATGRVELFNIENPKERREMPAKFSGMRLQAGDVHVFYGPCGGGYGDPLDRPAEDVLEDVLDDFCTLEQARTAYGVVIDLEAETVDEAGTESLRRQMRSSSSPVESRPLEREVPDFAASTPAIAPPPREQERLPVPAGQPSVPAVVAPPPSTLAIAAPPASRSEASDVSQTVRRLHEPFGPTWSFEIVSHERNGEGVAVVGEVRANGTRARETGKTNGGNGLSVGEQFETAANDSLRRCADVCFDRAPLHRAAHPNCDRTLIEDHRRDRRVTGASL